MQRKQIPQAKNIPRFVPFAGAVQKKGAKSRTISSQSLRGTRGGQESVEGQGKLRQDLILFDRVFNESGQFAAGELCS